VSYCIFIATRLLFSFPGKSYTLQDFEAVANEFEKAQLRERHFVKNIGKEKEYWKIINDANV
jgi:hypothetical protein